MIVPTFDQPARSLTAFSQHGRARLVDEKLVLTGRTLLPGFVDEMVAGVEAGFSRRAPRASHWGRCPPGTDPSHPAREATLVRASQDQGGHALP